MNITSSSPRCRVTQALPLLSFLLLAAIGPAHADELRISGTGNAMGVMRLLADAYAKKHPNDTPKIIDGLGSSGAIKGVPAGKLELGVSARPLTDEERAQGIKDIEFARTVTVFAVSTALPVTGISRQDVADIYTGKKASWANGTPVRPIIRQQGDDNTRQIRSLSTAIDQAIIVADQRPGLPAAFTDHETVEKIESIPGAIGVTSLGLIRAEGRPLRPLALDGVEPTEKNARSGAYPMIKRYYLLQSVTLPAVNQRFVNFILSPAGQAILTQTGHWSP